MTDIRVVSEDDQEFAHFPIPRLLNKRTRARLSKESVPWKTARGLFCVSNMHGWCAAVTRDGDFGLLLSPLSEVHAAFKDGLEDPLNAQRHFVIGNNCPIKLSFACNDSVLVVAYQDGLLQVYDSTTILCSGTTPVSPAMELRSSGQIEDIAPNPDLGSANKTHVAVLQVGGVLEMLDLNVRAMKVYAEGVSSVSWSKQGHMLALGQADGLLTICAGPFTDRPEPSKATTLSSFQAEPHPVNSVKWLTEDVLHISSRSPTGTGVYALASLQTSRQAIELLSITPPFPNRDETYPFVASIGPWLSPSNGSGTVVVSADMCNEDIEILAELQGGWCQRSVENPLAIPVGEEEDNVVLSVTIDLTSSEPLRLDVNGEGKDFPPSPILLCYLSDGTLQAWNLAHPDPCPAMSQGPVLGEEAAMSEETPSDPSFAAVPLTMQQQPTPLPTTPPPTAPAFSPEASPGPQTAFGQGSSPAFGQVSGLGASPAQPAFGKPAFGAPAFGAPSFGTPSFGQPSTFGSGASTQGAFSSFAAAPAKFGQSGFGAFANKPSSFSASGVSSFGFGAGSSPATPSKPPASAPPMETANSAMSVSEATLDDLSMADSPMPSPVKKSSDSPFGAFGQPASQTTPPASEPKPSEVKPAFGFGASFGNSLNESPFAKASQNATFGGSATTSSASEPKSSEAKPALGFGASFGNSLNDSPFAKTSQKTGSPAPEPAFKAQQSASSPQPSSFMKASSGFGAFGGGVPSDSPFAKAAASGSVPSASSAFKPSSGFGAFGGASSSTPSAFASAAAPTSTPSTPKALQLSPAASPAPAFGKSAFGASAFGQPAFGAPSKIAFGQSSFGSPTPATPSQASPSTTTQSPSVGGFGAFAGSMNSFASAAKPSTPATPGSSTTSIFGASSSEKPSTPKDAKSGSIDLTQREEKPSTPAPVATSSKPPGVESPPPSPVTPQKPTTSQPSFSLSTPSTPPAFGAFGGLTVSNSGFGAFGTQSSSSGASTTPTTTPKKPEPAESPSGTPPSNLFGKPSSSTSPFGAPTTPSPFGVPKTPPPFGATGSKSALGAVASTSPFGTPPSTSPFGAPPSTSPFGQPPSPSPFAGQAPTTPLKSVFGQTASTTPKTEKKIPKSPEAEEDEGSEPEDSDQCSEDGSEDADGGSDASDGLSLSDEEEEGHLSVVDEEEEEDDGVIVGEEEEETEEEAEEEVEEEQGEEEQEDQVPDSKREEKAKEAVQQRDVPSSSSLVPKDEPKATPSLFKPPTEAGSGNLLRAGSPSQIPLPKSRSPSNERDVGPAPEFSRAGSTTPPGTPIKVQAPTPQKGVPNESPTSTTSPFSLGLGRPNTRPTRSSPLANAPVSRTSEDSEEDQTLEIQKAQPDRSGSEEPATKRMKTPPLLFSPSPAVKSEASSASASPSFGGKGFSFSGPTSPQTPASKPVFSLPPTPNSPSLGSLPSSTPAKPAGFTSPAPPQLGPVSFGAKPMPALSFTAQPPALTPPKPAPGPTPAPTFPPASTFASGPAFSSVPTSAPAPTGASAPTFAPAQSRALASPAAPPTNQVTPPQPGLQTECAYLFASLAKELEMLRNMAQDANKRCADLVHKDRIAHFGKEILNLGGVLNQLVTDSKSSTQSLNRLESGMLKATTRREEVNRFAEAKRDGDFSKMLNSRTLGPDHLEAQKQLRGSINLVRDRIEKLEAHLAASKDKLNRAKTERAGLKAPSLDTINRTCRNIDLAIDNQLKEVQILKTRMSALQPDARPTTSSLRDVRLPDPISRRPFNVTPHVAFTTAAALNAERSAQKFKHALLAARSQPLLNKTAKLSPSTLSSFNTPQKLSSSQVQPPSTPDFSGMTLDDFGDGKFQIGGGTPLTTRRGATGGSRKHHIIPLKRSPGAPPPSSSPSFDWGPLPSFMPASPSPVR